MKNRTNASSVGLALVLAAVTVAVMLWRSPMLAAEEAVILPAPAVDNPKAAGAAQTAVLSGGCFWGVQGVFEHVRGVQRVLAGYAGGERSTAHYEMVSSGDTGHAESVKITFDPAAISYGQILQIAFSVVHDPTQLNRQGPDVGTSYRSAIFYANDEQKRLATSYIQQLDQAHIFPGPIVTQVVPLKGFYRAEDYHQDYALHNPDNPYILVCDRPKIAALKEQFPDLFVDYKGGK